MSTNDKVTCIKFWTMPAEMLAARKAYEALPWHKKIYHDLMNYLTKDHGDEMP